MVGKQFGSRCKCVRPAVDNKMKDETEKPKTKKTEPTSASALKLKICELETRAKIAEERKKKKKEKKEKKKREDQSNMTKEKGQDHQKWGGKRTNRWWRGWRKTPRSMGWDGDEHKNTGWWIYDGDDYKWVNNWAEAEALAEEACSKLNCGAQ